MDSQSKNRQLRSTNWKSWTMYNNIFRKNSRKFVAKMAKRKIRLNRQLFFTSYYSYTEKEALWTFRIKSPAWLKVGSVQCCLSDKTKKCSDYPRLPSTNIVRTFGAWRE